MEKGSLANLVE